ncbi:arf-GAP with dual PH domain-containing protein 1-like [Ptychodera flava]|uniref:arf-GAP with dual PH domain-containing protein 1-like n=1 Tax=Ptychodera flava TaxID=63121 RepID=UPI00396A4E0A
MAEKNKNALLDLKKRPGNHVCADCGKHDPDFAAYNIGIFICKECADIHKFLGRHISKVKSVKVDEWTDEEVEFMASNGNLIAKRKYERYVAPCYKKPGQRDYPILREQWIRAKYERKEFMDEKQQTYLLGRKEGFLWKRGKDDSRFQSRRFILDEEENVIKYYVDPSAKEPKAALKLSDINVTFCPDKIGNPNGMQISYMKDDVTRNLFVYSDDGQDIVDWFNAIRSAKFNRMKIENPGANKADLVDHLNTDYTKEGFLYKSGPRGKEAYKKRWFSLESKKLKYYSDPLDPHPKGEIYLGNKKDGYTTREGLPAGIHTHNGGFSFTLATPGRDYYLSAETEESRVDWMDILNKTVDPTLKN